MQPTPVLKGSSAPDSQTRILKLEWGEVVIAIIREVMENTELYHSCNKIKESDLAPLTTRIRELQIQLAESEVALWSVRVRHLQTQLMESDLASLSAGVGELQTQLAKSDLASLSAKIHDLQTQLVESDLASLSDGVHELQAQLVESDLASLSAKIHDLQTQLAESDLASLSARVHDLQTQLPDPNTSQIDDTAPRAPPKLSKAPRLIRSYEALPIDRERLKAMAELSNLERFTTLPVSDFSLMNHSYNPNDGEGGLRSVLGCWVEDQLTTLTSSPLENYRFCRFYAAFEACSNAWSEVAKVKANIAQPEKLDEKLPADSPVRTRRVLREEKELRYDVMFESTRTALKALDRFSRVFFYDYMDHLEKPDYATHLRKVIEHVQNEMAEISELIEPEAAKPHRRARSSPVPSPLAQRWNRLRQGFGGASTEPLPKFE
jgi:hypothetical protein